MKTTPLATAEALAHEVRTQVEALNVAVAKAQEAGLVVDFDQMALNTVSIRGKSIRLTVDISFPL